MAILVAALFVAEVTLNFDAIGGLLLLIGISMTNYSKQRRSLMERHDKD